MTPAWKGRWLSVRTALMGPWLSWIPTIAAAASLVIVYLSNSDQGLWEDGYFLKRVARNFWEHGSFSWNVEDGPIYGMTSQTLQVVGTLLYGLAPNHFVLSLKAVLYAALLLALLVLGRAVRGDTAAHEGAGQNRPSRWPAPPALCVVGLTISLVVQVVLVGLETALAVLAVAVALWQILRSSGTRRDGTRIVLAALLVYLTRPDAVLIVGLVLAGSFVLALLRDGDRSKAKFYAGTLLGIGAGLALLLLVFKLYYGTSLPLPFYVKTHGVSHQSAGHIAIFAREKLKNATQIAFFAVPFVFVACHSRKRSTWLLLAAAFGFFAYHFTATIETMGHMSRFYLPGWVGVVAAACLAYPAYQGRLRRGLWPWLGSAALVALWIGAFVWLKQIDRRLGIDHKMDTAFDVPTLVAVAAVLLIPPAFERLRSVLVGAIVLGGAWLIYPIGNLEIRDDETILLAQIRPRMAFRGLARLRALDPKVVYHTDMGAPGVLLPNARVVDLDGLLNEDITLHGARFEELCLADRPDAIFVPNHTYRELRNEVLSSKCIENYSAVTPMRGTPLFIRRDRLREYKSGS